MSLIEVLITIAIIGLISSAATFGVAHIWTEQQRQAAEENAARIRSQALLWRQQHTSEDCPTVERLVQDKIMDKASKNTDPWGGSYTIVCNDEEVSAGSWGKDRKEGTTDDIWVPSKR
jgi:prepilin-type N-terminal cleavage/methylation domain-containing protein